MRKYIYFNIRKKCFSVRVGKQKIYYTKKIKLRNVKYLLSEKRKKRVLKENVKNVHAGISGIECDFQYDSLGCKITYNPYFDKKFKIVRSGEYICWSEYCLLKIQKEKPLVFAIGKIHLDRDCDQTMG